MDQKEQERDFRNALITQSLRGIARRLYEASNTGTAENLKTACASGMSDLEGLQMMFRLGNLERFLETHEPISIQELPVPQLAQPVPEIMPPTKARPRLPAGSNSKPRRASGQR